MTFVKGKSGNPKGRRKGTGIRPDLKHVKLMSPDTARRMIQKLLDLDLDGLKALREDPSTPLMELMVCSIITKGLEDGDHGRLNFLFDRTIGKVLERHEIELKPVIYRTQVRADGALIQEVVDEDGKEVETIDITPEPEPGIALIQEVVEGEVQE